MLVTAARLEDQTLEGDLFLIATGAWTPQLAKILRCRIPIEPGKGYSVTMPRPVPCPTVPLIFPEHRVAVTPLEHDLRLGSIMEFVGYDSSIRPARLRLLTDGAAQYLRCPLPSEFSETWYGWRPMTYDSTPVIGPCPGFSNVYLATGHNMLGLSMAPATGRLISEIMAGTTPHLPTHCYSASRFATALSAEPSSGVPIRPSSALRAPSPSGRRNATPLLPPGPGEGTRPPLLPPGEGARRADEGGPTARQASPGSDQG